MYQLTLDPKVVIRLSDGANIPTGHPWFEAYELWCDEGNAPEPALDTKLSEARSRRDSLLRASDWTQLSDCPLNAMEITAWANYRADLRALPSLPGFPEVTWPAPPDMPAGSANQAPPQL
jgi:hypothetical protein